MNDNSMTSEIQVLLLQMLGEFRRICDMYNLRWFAIGGTCIGAVRHKGFIPWDDDIDIGMPFEDYQKFREIVKKELSEPFEICDPHEKQHAYADAILRIHDMRTTIIINAERIPYPDGYMGIYLDIMPVSGLPDKTWKRLLFALQNRFYTRLNRLMRFPLKLEKTWRSRLVWLLISSQRRTKPFDYYLTKMEQKWAKYPFGETKYILFAWREGVLGIRPKEYTYQEIFPYADFVSYTELPFENTTIRVPVGYDDYLRRDFGDYMKLPSVENQISKHQGTAIIDLHTSYKEYAKAASQKIPTGGGATPNSF